MVKNENLYIDLKKETGYSHYFDNPCNQLIVRFARPSNMVNLFSQILKDGGGRAIN